MKLRWKIAQAAEIRWWQNYLKKKDKSDYLTWKKKYWRQFLADCAIRVAPAASCLDIGCGPAGIFTVLDQQAVRAIDPLLEDYTQKLKHFEPKDYPNVCFESKALEQVDSSELYDYVFCLNAINHVSDLQTCFDNLFALTKKGGRLVVSIDAHNHSFLKHIFRAIPGDILHPHQYDLKEYQEMITSRGGRIVKTIHKDKAFFFDYYVFVVERG